jgi:hypothetical protein
VSQLTTSSKQRASTIEINMADNMSDASVSDDEPSSNVAGGSIEAIENGVNETSPSKKKRRRKHLKKTQGGLNKKALAILNEPDGSSHPSDVAFQKQKVEAFMQNNPINPLFIRREKARLPYSVFKPHSKDVYFLKSIYEGRPPTAFFPYPAYVKLDRASNRVRTYSREDVEYLFMSFKIWDTTHIYNAVVNTCKNAGFVMVE